MAVPLLAIFLGQLMQGLFKSDLASSAASVREMAFIYLYFTIGIFVCSFLEVSFFAVSAQRQALRIRRTYLNAILRLSMAWYDKTKSSALADRLSSDVPGVCMHACVCIYVCVCVYVCIAHLRLG